MSGTFAGKALLFVESGTSTTGRLFTRTARCMGYLPVLVTTRPDRYACLRECGAPEVIVVPRIDEDELYDLVRRRFGGGEVAGITSSSERHAATAAALAARLGLPGPDAASVRAARDRSRQRELLAAGGVPVPAFRSVSSSFEAASAAREIGVPVVVRPADGSAGARACADAAEAEAHAAELFASGGDDLRVLVESLVAGDEFSVEVFSGRVVGIARKHLGAPPFFVEAGRDYPADVSARAASALADAALRGTALLGLGWGPLHWKLRIDREGRVVPMEVDPWLAGGFVPELVRQAEGIDLVRETLRLVVGRGAGLVPVRRRHASVRFLLAPGAGRLAAVAGMSTALGHPDVLEVSAYLRVGDELSVHGDVRDRIGHVVACAREPRAASRAAERARDAVRVRVDAPAEERESVLVMAEAAGVGGDAGRIRVFGLSA